MNQFHDECSHHPREPAPLLTLRFTTLTSNPAEGMLASGRSFYGPGAAAYGVEFGGYQNELTGARNRNSS